MSDTNNDTRRAMVEQIIEPGIDRRALIHLVIDHHGFESFTDEALQAMVRLIDAVEGNPTEKPSC